MAKPWWSGFSRCPDHVLCADLQARFVQHMSYGKLVETGTIGEEGATSIGSDDHCTIQEGRLIGTILGATSAWRFDVVIYIPRDVTGVRRFVMSNIKEGMHTWKANKKNSIVGHIPIIVPLYRHSLTVDYPAWMVCGWGTSRQLLGHAAFERENPWSPLVHHQFFRAQQCLLWVYMGISHLLSRTSTPPRCL